MGISVFGFARLLRRRLGDVVGSLGVDRFRPAAPGWPADRRVAEAGELEGVVPLPALSGSAARFLAAAGADITALAGDRDAPGADSGLPAHKVPGRESRRW